MTYYTPTPEEIHVGLVLYRKFSEGMFEAEIEVGVENIQEILQGLLSGKDYFIPYLDKYEIESLGFTNKRGHRYIWTHQSPPVGMPEYRQYSVDLYFLGKIVSIELVPEEGNVIPLFSGIIKSKSELVKLLKQLQIT